MSKVLSVRLSHVLGTAVVATIVVAALLSPGAATADPGGPAVLPALSGDAIAGDYIVTFASAPDLSSTADVASEASEMARRHGGQVGFIYASAVRGYSARMSEAEAAELAADPLIARVEQDARVRVADTQTSPTWGLDRIDQRSIPLSASYTYNFIGSAVSVYVIDTGIRTTHAQFGGRARSGYDFVDNDTDANDCNGHGTHVAGTIGGATYGVAKRVTLYGVKVLACDGTGTVSGVIAGIDWVTAHAVKPAVANLSLGGGASTSLDDAVRRSVYSGVTYAVAAGNSDADACGYSPARTAEAITVGATTSLDARASYSNYGTCVDLFAPGTDITSSWNSSDTATATISGTSMATPHVAGAAALYLANHATATPQQVRDALVAGATAGAVAGVGTGSPNRLLYTLADGPGPAAVGPYFENTADVAIPDAGPTVKSAITVSGVSGYAPSTLKVGVLIRHTFRGDLVIDLVAPDGSSYRLKNSNSSDGEANVNTTYTVNASSEKAAGTWRLCVRDAYEQDTGYLDKWTLQF